MKSRSFPKPSSSEGLYSPTIPVVYPPGIHSHSFPASIFLCARFSFGLARTNLFSQTPCVVLTAVTTRGLLRHLQERKVPFTLFPDRIYDLFFGGTLLAFPLFSLFVFFCVLTLTLPPATRLFFFFSNWACLIADNPLV